MPVKDSHAMTNRAIAREIGHRIDKIRLEQNISQRDVADKLGITVKTYRNLIDGGGKFESLIAVLRFLGCLEMVDTFIPESTFSPLELVKMRGRQRVRASKKSKKSIETDQQQKDLDW